MFTLAQGVAVDDISGIHEAYSVEGNNIVSNISVDKLKEVLISLCHGMTAPVFFFIEIPQEDSDEKKTYYLDNCTIDVAVAIIKRYGDILINDGIVLFGFGSHKDNDEIYVQEYKVLTVYSEKLTKYISILDKMQIPKENNIVTVWDILSENNTGELSAVEVENENIYDIIENLSAEGMYPA